MKQELFKSSVRSRFIKNLLCNTKIPIYNTVRIGDYIIKNCKYIYNISLIKCTKSGTLEGTGEFITLDDTFYWDADKVNETHSFTSNTGYYDSETHEWLGNYLRAYRDMKGINLMPFYNCFSGVYTDRFKLKYMEDTQGTYIGVYQGNSSYDTFVQGTETFNEAYIEKNPFKIFRVPVKLNKKYTIALDCDSNIRIAPAFINHGKLLEVSIGSRKLSLTDLYIQNKDSDGAMHPLSVNITNSEFIHPFIYTTTNNNQTKINGVVAEEDTGLTYEQLFQRYEKYFYLLIQVPSDNTSGLVILEGDYAEASVDKVFSNEIISEQVEDIVQTTTDYYGDISEYKLNNITDRNNKNYISSCPWISYAEVADLPFTNNQLNKPLIDISILDSSGNPFVYDFGYMEFCIKPNIYNNYNVAIYSWIPIIEGKIYIKLGNEISSKEISPYDPRNDDPFLDNMLISKLSLLQFNDEISYPFSDVLIEYLLLNVIDSADEISDDIKRIQRWFGVQSSPNFTYGAWNNALRIDVFNTTKYIKTIPHLDIVGYVDRNVESTTL